MARIGRDALGGLAIAAASFLFGGVVVVGKTATDRGLPVETMLAIRFAVAAMLLAVVLAVQRRSLTAPPRERVPLLVLGVAGYAIEALLFFLAVERGTATAVTLLFFTYPVAVTLLAVLLRLGKPRPLVLGALAAATAGTTIVVGSSGDIGLDALGIAFALGSAGMFAAYLIGAEVAVRDTQPLVASMWVSAAAAGGLAIYAAASGARPPEGFDEWWRILAMGTFTAGAFVFLFAGLRALGAVRTSVVAAMEPLSTTLLAVAFLGETLRAPTIGGGALILMGAVAASVARARRRGAEAPVP